MQHPTSPAQAADRRIWKLSKAHVGSHDAFYRSNLPASASQSLDEAERQGAGRHILKEEGAGGSASGSMAAKEEGAGKGEEVVVGYWKQHSLLTHVVLRNAGHMVRCRLHMLDPLRSCLPSTVVSVRTHNGRITTSQGLGNIVSRGGLFQMADRASEMG